MDPTKLSLPHWATQQSVSSDVQADGSPYEMAPLPEGFGPDGSPIATKDELGMGWKMAPAAAHLMDGISTYAFMKKGTGREVNPLMKPFEKAPEAGLALKALMAYLAYKKMDSSKKDMTPAQRKKMSLLMTALPAIFGASNMTFAFDKKKGK